MRTFQLRDVCRLPWFVFLLMVSLTLLCSSNLFSFHTMQTIYLEKHDYALSRKRFIQARNLYNAVSQVQNQLTDISATLGLDRLDQGFDRARQAAEEFRAGLANLRQLMSRQVYGMDSPFDLTSMPEQFDRFYAQGIDMAHAYIQSGTLRGNQKMIAFDAQADQLRESLTGLISILEQHTKRWQRKMAQSPDVFVIPSGVSNVLWLHLLGSGTRAHLIEFLTWFTESAHHQDRRVDLSLLAQELRGNVIEVQQWLTDLSATRGRDGLDEGATQALRSAEHFRARLPALLILVKGANDQGREDKVAHLDTRFEEFYARGQAMATAYIQGGAKQGNPLMTEFDNMADDLEKELLQFIIPAMEEAHAENYRMELVHHSLQDVRKALFLVLFLSLAATVGSILWLVSCLKSNQRS
ncbi:MAG: hypothetical protein HQL64_05590 [Magnetococcales bacterium]|nr:hypothetical protein [Magnetococcales bacterium]